MNGVIVASVQPEDFRAATSYNDPRNCPLAMALDRQGHSIEQIGRSIAVIDGKEYQIPYEDIWGGEKAQFSGNRINRLIFLSKFHIPWTIPTAKVVLESK